MTRTTDITSFSEHRKHLRDNLNRVKDTGRPLFITSNGEADAVVLSPKAYDELMDRAELPELLKMIERAEVDIREGKLIDARESLRQIARDKGINLDR